MATKKKARVSPRASEKAAKKGSRKPVKSVSKKALARETLSLFENVHSAKIKLIGIGGGGGNIASEIASRAQRFDFVGANTDSQALKELSRKVKSFPFGQDLTGGLGCGMNAELGERAAKAEKDRIKRLLEGSDICILIASLGGGTGSGATATFAEVAQELHILCLGIFTLPFAFEGERRKQIAQTALETIKPLVNAYVVIPNEHIFQVIDEKTPLKEALSVVNKKLAATLQGFMDMLSLPGLINIDFADVRSILEGRGRLAFINSADGAGAAKAQEVVQGILENPLYTYTIAGADRVLFNVGGDRNMKMQEVAHISSAISAYNPRARVIFGMSCSARAKDRLKVTLFAIGCDESGKPQKKARQRKRGGAGEKHREQMQEGILAAKGAEGKDAVPGRAGQQAARQSSRPEQSLKGKQAGLRSRDAERGQAKTAAKGKKRPQRQSASPAPHKKGHAQKSKVRRNALDLKKAVDEELKELEEREREWDIPAFLRNKA